MRLIRRSWYSQEWGVVALIGAVCLIGWVQSAQGQTAGGDGRALDSNQSTTQGKTNGLKKRFLLNNINNAIVTGNVAGGKGFRGDLGYSAAGDFRGRAGSDDLFSFSADSYLPGLIFERTNFLQVPTTRGITNARYRSGLQPSLILRRSTAVESFSSRPFTNIIKRRRTVTSDPSGALGEVNRPSLLRRSMTDVDFQKRYTSQYRYSVSISGQSELLLDGFGAARLSNGMRDRIHSASQLRSYLLRNGSGTAVGTITGSSAAGVVGRSYLDLFGMISGQERGGNASERGLPETEMKRGTPNEQLSKELEKIDEKDNN